MFILELYITTLVAYTFYLAVMHLKQHKEHITPVVKIFGYPILFIGLVVDMLLTVIFGTIIFLDLPRELTLTSRLKRYRERSDFRGKFARWICRELLNKFDPSGFHCGEPK